MKYFPGRSRIEKAAYIIITLAVLSAAVFFVCRIIYAGIIALPYPKELLEPSNIALTNEFLAGNSPYTLASLSRSVPGTNYDYPPLCSLVAAGIAKLTGCGAVKAHFFISIVSILASAVIGYAAVAGYFASRADGEKISGTAKYAAPSLAALIFMFCHFRYGYISASPDDFGLLLLLLTSFAAVLPRIKNKPVVCAVGITLCFYTKQYFVFVAAGLFIYMMLYSWREAVRLFVWTLVMNILTGAVITVFWPLYWTKAFFFTYLGSAVGGGGALSTLTDQFIYLLTVFGPLFAVIAVCALIALVRFFRKGKGISAVPKIRENDPFAMSAVQCVVMIIPLSVIGRNDGAFLSYFLQLWMPYITVTALICLERMNILKNLIYAAIAAYTIYFGFARLPLHILTPEEISEWDKAYEYTERYSALGDVYFARSLAYDPASDAGECICGHDGEVSTDTVEALTSAGLPDALTEHARLIVGQNMEYRKMIDDKAAGHVYSLITFDDSGAYTPFDERSCEELGYRCIDRLTLCLGNMPYEVLFYAPGQQDGGL